MTPRRLRGRPTPFKDIRIPAVTAPRRSAVDETTAAYVAAKVQVEGHAQGARRGSSASPRRANKGCRRRRGARFRPRGPTPSFQPRIRRCLPAARVARDTARTRYGPPPRDSFMANKMLIDSTHPEETRVVVLRGNRVEEFDFESANRRQLRGNIYLAKVTRVEPSLQAAFIDYGGNRHGFLAFSEIHPDYYQIPVADRQALIAEEERAHRDAEDEIDRRASGGGRSRRPRREAAHERHDATRSEAAESSEAHSETNGANGEHADDARRGRRGHHETHDAGAERRAARKHRAGRSAGRASGRASPPKPPQRQRQPASRSRPRAEPRREPSPGATRPNTRRSPTPKRRRRDGRDRTAPRGGADRRRRGERSPPAARTISSRSRSRPPPRTARKSVELVGGADAMEEVQERTPRYRRTYKIQEVIKRRQIMLVQVVKEERGTKGAALTTYLSLAGRYSVLMPNTARGGGISPQDHQRARPQEAEGDRAGPGSAGRHGRDPAHRRREPHQDGSEARLRISAAHVGDGARLHAEVDRADAGLRGRLADQALDPRPLQQGHRGDPGRGRRRPPRSARLHAHADAEPRQEREALPGPAAGLHALRHREPARRDVHADRAASLRRLHRDQPDRGAGRDRRELGPRDARAPHRGHRDQDQLRGGRRGRAPASPARPCGSDRHRLHRHGRAAATTARSSGG